MIEHVTLEIPRRSTYRTYQFGEEYSFEELKDKLTEDKIILDGQSVNFRSVRLQTFIKKGNVCVCCNRVGTTFRLQKPKNGNAKSYHVGLWSEDNVQMTKDHIHPKSLGGSDKLDNMQTMCEICNQAKGNRIEHEEIPKDSFTIFDNYPKFDEYKELVVTFNETNRVNVFSEIEKYPEFQEQYNYIKSFAKEIFLHLDKKPSRKNKYWGRIPKHIKKEIKENV